MLKHFMIGGMIGSLFLTGLAWAVNYNPLPDTGQHKCYDSSFSEIPCPLPGSSMAQDGSYDADEGKLQQSFRNNGDGTVTDNNTGLVWQQGDDGRTRTFDEASSYCENLSLAGYDDWRLPVMFELATIVDYGKYNPAIDTSIFDCRQAQYWTGSSYLRDASKQWIIGFVLGDGDAGARTNRYYVRCVRGGDAYTAGSYIDNGDGTVTDVGTGLVWQQTDDSAKRNWTDALAYCESLPLGGHDDWRLPDIQELKSIVDYTRIEPAMDPVFDYKTDFYWSSTTYANNAELAWFVLFDNGDDYALDKSYAYYVRCVRGGLSPSSGPDDGDDDNDSPVCQVTSTMPSQQNVDLCTGSCMDYAPVKINGNRAAVCFSYDAPAYMLAGFMDKTFTSIYWLVNYGSTCNVSTSFGMLSNGAASGSCEVYLPSDVLDNGYVFWMLSGIPVENVDWLNTPYELMFYMIE